MAVIVVVVVVRGRGRGSHVSLPLSAPRHWAETHRLCALHNDKVQTCCRKVFGIIQLYAIDLLAPLTPLCEGIRV